VARSEGRGGRGEESEKFLVVRLRDVCVALIFAPPTNLIPSPLSLPPPQDDFDDLESTGHVLIRHKGRAVASTRIVNGNHTPLEAEKYGWIDVRGRIAPFVNNPNNIAEPSRVVACRSIRGTNVVPLMYLHCLDWFMTNNIENFIGMCNTEARPLIEHYSKWAQAKWITDKPFTANEFIKGRELDMCFVSVGDKGSKERENMLLTNFAPAFAAYSLMKSPK